MSSHGNHSVHWPMALMGMRCLHPLPNAHDPMDIHFNYTLPEVFTCPLWIAPVDVHGRSCNLPLTHPREVWLVWHWVITRPLSTCSVISQSLPLGVGLTEVGLVHWSHAWQTPTSKRMPVSDMMRRSWFWWRMYDCVHWSVTL